MPPPAHDLRCRLLSLPRLLPGIPPAPYLAADPAAAAAQRARLSGLPRPRVGLVRAGGARPGSGHAEAIDARRSIPFDAVRPLLDLRGPAFVSLAPGLRDAHPNLASPALGDFADTAALAAALDIVVSVDTAVAHLAGAIGRPVWLLDRHAPCWRWAPDGGGSRWYPTMRVFRQAAPGDWAWVVERVARALTGA